jgi:hypothetical protein
LLQQQVSEVRKSNIAMITSVDTEDWTDKIKTQPFTQLARAILNIQLTVLTSGQFLNIISGEYTVR